jgi:D-amino-acid dehydrogenase
MRIVVIGAGAVGNATAFYLHKHGHEVVVIERQPGVALETSLGNGGVVHASEVEPWSQPGMPRKILSWLGQESAPLLLRYGAIPHMWRWGIEFIANCTPPRFRQNAEANLRVALLSLQSLQEIRTETGVQYDRGTKGVLKIYRDPRSLDDADAGSAQLAKHGLVYRRVSPTECADIEPALQRTSNTLAGGLFFERDEVGDPNKFHSGVAAWLAARGVEYRFNTSVNRVVRDGNCATGVETSSGRVQGDAIVVAMGSHTPLLLRSIGIRVPIYPVKGISLTVPSAPWPSALKVPVIDDSGLFGLVPIGDRLRVSGSAEIARYDTTPSPRRGQAVVDNVLRSFPDFAACYDPGTAKWWAGLRPVTPSGVAYMGRTGLRNLFVNAGHGHLGWTMSCGAGRIVAAMVVGETPEINTTGFPRVPGAPLH